MQVNKKDISSVITEFSVIVPAADVQQEVEKWLVKRATTLKMDGFRKGKVPLDVVRQHYLDQAEAASIEEIIQKFSSQTLKNEKLEPIARPRYRLDSYERGKNLSFTLTVEQTPYFDLKDLKTLKIEKIKCDITPEEIDSEFQKFCDDYKKPLPAQKMVENGDFVRISCQTMCCGKIAKELCVEDIRVRNGYTAHNEFLDLISAQLLGKSAGDSFEFKEHFSKNFPIKTYADKKALITLKVLEVLPLSKAVFSEAEAKEMGFETFEKFKESFEQTLRNRRNETLKLCHKRAVLDALAKEYSFDIPETIVDNDFQNVWRYVKPEIDEARRVDDEDVRGKTDEDIAREYREVSIRRVRLGFIINKIAENQKISVTEKHIQAVLSQEITKYPGKEKELLQFYKKNPQAMERLLAPVLEDLVVEKILELSTSIEKIISKEDLTGLLNEILPE